MARSGRNMKDKLRRLMNRQVTILVVPHSSVPLWRGGFSLGFLAFLFALWTGVTLWAGYISSRHVDYWVTKAHNEVMRAKMTAFADELARSREMLEMARATDREMRSLLGMGARQAIIETDEPLGVGGPTALDSMSLREQFMAGREPDLKAVHREAERVRRETESRLASFQEIAWYIAQQRTLFRSTPNSWPAEGRITSPFGYRFSPFRGDEEFGEFHPGLDIASNLRDAPIRATADGVVRYAGWAGGYGNMVMIDHGYGYTTLYGHSSKVLVKKGQRVGRGDMIAYMGTTGRSTGQHVHYEVWRDGRPVNPLHFLKIHAEPSLAKAGEAPSAGD